MTGARSRLHRLVLWGSLAAIVASWATIAVIVATRGTGDSIGDRIDSLRSDEASGADGDEREEVLATAREFAVRFNTYNPDMLDGREMPEYASLGDSMTVKFRSAFTDECGGLAIAKNVVFELRVSSTAAATGVGLSSIDDDSAEALVAGSRVVSRPIPDDRGEGSDEESGEGSGDDPDTLTSAPDQFRYRVLLVKVEGEWLVDDLDDIDDGVAPLGSTGACDSAVTPSESPSDGATEQAPSGEQSEATEDAS